MLNPISEIHCIDFNETEITRLVQGAYHIICLMYAIEDEFLHT